MQLKVRRQKVVRSTTAMLAVGISEDGQREFLGLEMALSETEQRWRRFIRQLKERGLSGVKLATSDAHEGLRQALEEAPHHASRIRSKWVRFSPMHHLIALLAALLVFAPASYAQVEPGQAFAGKVLPVAGGKGSVCESLPDRR